MQQNLILCDQRHSALHLFAGSVSFVFGLIVMIESGVETWKTFLNESILIVWYIQQQREQYSNYRTIIFLSSVKETAGMDFHRVCVWWFSLDHIWCLHCTYFIKGSVNLTKSEVSNKFSAFSHICDAKLCCMCSFHRHSNFVQTAYRGRTAENHSKQKRWRFRTLVLVDLFANGHTRTVSGQVYF